MKEKILAFLKSKLSGVSESFLLGVADTFSKTVKEEKDIETIFTDGIIETLKFSATQLQVEGDRRATEAQKTALKNFQEKHGLDENGKPIEDPKKGAGRPKKDVDPDEPAWFKTYREAKDTEFAELKTKLDTQEKEKTSAALSDKIMKHEKLKGIPASWLKGRNLIVNSEGEIDQLVAGIETDYNGFKQEMAEQGVVISVPPSGQGSIKEGEAVGKALAEKRNTNASEGVKGKKV